LILLVHIPGRPLISEHNAGKRAFVEMKGMRVAHNFATNKLFLWFMLHHALPFE